MRNCCVQSKVMNMEYTLSGDDKSLVGGGGEETVSITHTYLKLKNLSQAIFFPPPFLRHDGGQLEGYYESCVGHC